jgi:hypothetical protein
MTVQLRPLRSGYSRRRVEDGSYGGFIAFDLDQPTGVVKAEHTRCQSENDRGVSAHDGIKIATIMRAHLYARACHPNLDQYAIDRDTHRQ